MSGKVIKEVLENFYPLIIIILLLIFKFISFTQFLIGYLLYCIIIYCTTKTYLFYIKTDFNEELLENCPSIKNPKFKQYFLLPFTFCQFILLQIATCGKNKKENKIHFEEEKVDNEGASIFWAYFEKSEDIHSKQVLFILPGITGKYNDPYIQNIAFKGLENNFDVVIFQMRTLSSEMKMPKNGKYIDFYEDINNSLIKVRNKNQNKIFGVGFSYGANLLTGYLGNKNLETNYLEGGTAISNPFDLYMSQRFGEDTLYESLITFFERQNYLSAVNSVNKDDNNNKYIKVDNLLSNYYVKNFDAEFFGKILGYKNGDEYYRGISSARYIKNINKPLLVIHSKDDPICTYKGIPIDDVCENKNIIFISTDKGAHSCFIENDKYLGFSPKNWIFKPTFEFINYLKIKSKKSDYFFV